MKKRLMAMLLAAAVAAIGAMPAQAVSLWDDGSSLFSDRKAGRIGDVVFVEVNEVINDKDEGKVTNSKETSNNIGNGFGILDFIRSFGLTATNSMSGNTKVERKKNLRGTISCLVIDVLPNGNLVIEGNSSMISGAEKMKMKLTGVVRPMDINADNTVSSRRVANADIAVSGKGIISSTQRPGVISQILTAIF